MVTPELRKVGKEGAKCCQNKIKTQSRKVGKQEKNNTINAEFHENQITHCKMAHRKQPMKDSG